MNMTEQDRELIERVQGCSIVDGLDDFGLFSFNEAEIAALLAAARAEAAPVVDEAAVDRAIAAVNEFGPEPMALEDRRRALIRAALEAALAEPNGGQDA